MTTKTELLKEFEEWKAKGQKIQEQLNAIPDDKPTGRWKPEFNDDYLILDNDGKVCEATWNDHAIDGERYALNNVYQTEEEAKKALEQKLATVRVLDRIAELNAQQGWVCDWSDGEDKYYLGFDGGLCWAITDSFKVMPTQYYGSLKTIETVTKEMPEDCKLMLGVD